MSVLSIDWERNIPDRETKRPSLSNENLVQNIKKVISKMLRDF